MNRFALSLVLYAVLGMALLGLAGWMIYQLLSSGEVKVDMVAFITVLFMAFRDVISKMGDVVRIMSGKALPAPEKEPSE